MEDKIKTILAGIDGLEERTKNSDCGTEFRNGQNRAYVLVRELVYQQFPELQESKDERIRKWIVNYIHHGAFNEEEHPMALKAVEYLEKQKEQNPVEWSEEDEKMRFRIIGHLTSFIYTNSLYGDDAKECIDWLKSHRPQPKVEWSERDKRIMNELITIMDGGKVMSGTYLSEYVAWLKDLPERFNIQPKQEWNEKDKRKLNRIYEILGHAADDKGFLTSKRIIGDKEAIELQDFLKSLRPSWKPSEEQIEALEHFIRSWGESGTMSPQNTILCAAKSLLYDLQKL